VPALLVSGLEETSTPEVQIFFDELKGDEVDGTVTSWGT
jgi:hypothetical protein